MATTGRDLERFGKILIESKLTSTSCWEDVKREFESTHKPLEKILAGRAITTEEEAIHLLEFYYGVPYVKLSDYILDREVINYIPEELCRKLKLIPIRLDKNSITIAMADPGDIYAVDLLKQRLNMDVESVYASIDSINNAINRYYLAHEVAEEKDEKIHEQEVIVGEAPATKLVNDIIKKALSTRASDIHFEPIRTETLVRIRIDGILRLFTTYPKALHPAIVARLKIMGGLKIDEKRLPQDGRAEIRLKAEQRAVDLRVSTLPVMFGEKVVLRILDKEISVMSIDTIGFCKQNLDKLKKLIQSSQGLIMICGPTGCGKTTTSYAICNQIRSIEKNIISVEDPVEYQIDLVNQVQVHSKIGLDFSNALRAILRQDPDIILVGEIRDFETAQMSVQAALTGHLVVCTFHTNDTPTAITRLVDIGIMPFLVASSVSCVIAQRLIRQICPRCKKEYKPSAEEWEAVFGKQFMLPKKIYKGTGCINCQNTGYYGRTAVSEILVLTERLRRAMVKNPDTDTLMNIAREEGIVTLKEDALTKVVDGITALDEILRMNLY